MKFRSPLLLEFRTPIVTVCELELSICRLLLENDSFLSPVLRSSRTCCFTCSCTVPVVSVMFLNNPRTNPRPRPSKVMARTMMTMALMESSREPRLWRIGVRRLGCLMYFTSFWLSQHFSFINVAFCCPELGETRRESNDRFHNLPTNFLN